MYRMLPQRGQRVLIPILILLFFSHAALAQSSARADREARWASLQLPTGKFTRFVDKAKGISFRVPADWAQQPGRRGGTIFKGSQETANVILVIDNIPDGLGVAAYVSSFLQSIRNEPIKPESTIVRRVSFSGLEWREVTYEFARDGDTMRQVLWFTASGPRAYGLILTASPDQIDKFEPIFKRIVSSTHIGAAGHWDEEYENLRANFTSGANSEVDQEKETAAVTESLRGGALSIEMATDRIAQLFASSPETAIDLITDPDPQVRTAAIMGIAKSSDPKIIDLMVWALADQDLIASTAAAHTLAAIVANGALPIAIKSKLAALAENPAAIVRAGAAMNEAAARELMAEMLSSDNPKEQIAALRLAFISEKFDLELPFAKLFASPDPGMPLLLTVVLERHPSAGAVEQLVKFLRTDNELWAVRVLGAIAPPEIEQELNKRISEIDARFDDLPGAVSKMNGSKTNGSNRTATTGTRARAGSKPTSTGITGPPPPPASQDSTTPLPPRSIEEWKKMPERIRLAFLRGDLYEAANKIKYRGQWDQARTEDERRRIKSELENQYYYAADRPRLSSKKEAAAAGKLDAAALAKLPNLPNLKNAPTTGETIFPKESFSYAMAPDFAATMDRLDSALSGVQMATVRDQMNFAFILKALKARLASSVGADFTGDASQATGIDLKSPIAMASWFPREGAGVSSAARGALTLRVTDRARFERLLATYQQELGDFDDFIRVSPGLVRFAGMIPGAAPMFIAYRESDQSRGAIARSLHSGSSESRLPSLKPIAYVMRDESLPITTIIRPAISPYSGAGRQTICVAYFGDTAVVSSSPAGIADLIAAGASGETIARSEAYTKARSEKGEIVFFSRLDSLLKTVAELTEAGAGKSRNEEVASFINAFGFESGALQLTGNSWETVFRIGLADNDFTKSFTPFKADQLAAPRDLLPRSTVLYAGAIVDPPKLYSALKSLESGNKKKDTKEKEVTVAGTKKLSAQRDKEIEADIEKLVIPNMQGEIAAAVVSFEPTFKGSHMPALALAVRLKNGELAAAYRSGKLFSSIHRWPNETVLGSPIVALGDQEPPIATVTRDYMIIADSIETMRLLEAKEKLSSSRDYARSTKDTPADLAIFAAFNLESAGDEAGKVLADKSMQQALVLSTAVSHAFHSQRAYLSHDKDGLAGRLSVSFDREGRYSVGDLAKAAGYIDLANAMIEPKGLSVIDSPRVESMTLRVSAKAPGVGPRLRDDLAKFDFQRIESSSDSAVVVTTSARRIPEKLTIGLPVRSAEFTQYLQPTERINSVDPRVVALARQIAGTDKDGRSVARKIGEWTYRNLKWKKVESDTVETLASREADCLEHSELYVALARALGLPARVVTGAALSGGSFGAHAWVEVYLGKWVEIDPTWGLMDHVDATHLRFDGDAFVSYAMLNQLELEIDSVRRKVADYQRDPLRLAREVSLHPETGELAFDLTLAAEQALGRSRWQGLNDKQRAAVIGAFEKTVQDIRDNWKFDTTMRPRLLQSEIKADRASITLLRGDELSRLTLARRDGAWFITEQELLDEALPEFADALLGALEPAGRRRLASEGAFDTAMNDLEKLIAREGEKPELLLLKARVLENRESREIIETYTKKKDEAAGKDKETEKDKDRDKAASVASLDVYKEVARRWPDFAPGRRALASRLLPLIFETDANQEKPVKKDVGPLLAELQAYARLVSYDPRPWRDMALVHEKFGKLEDATADLEKAIELDRENLEIYKDLIDFQLNHGQPEKAKSSLTRMLKVSADADKVFGIFRDSEDGYEPKYAASLENLLLSFSKEMEGSAIGWVLLAELQDAQKKNAAAIKSIQRSLAIEPSSESYVYLSMLLRSERRYAESLDAADRGLKLEEDDVAAHFERACALARLGRKDEALAALKRMLEIDADTYFDLEEPDLEPLAELPEFKAIKEKVSKPAGTPK